VNLYISNFKAMKKFIRDIVTFVTLFLVLFHIYPEISYYTEYYKKNVAGTEIYEAITKSLEKHKQKKLVLGDSVGKQILDQEIDSMQYISLCTNQAISLAGQYILLKNYITSGNSIENVILIMHPLSFRNNLNQNFTFNYFIKPFYTTENSKYLENYAITQIKKIPFYYLANYHPIKISLWSPPIYKTEETSTGFSTISKLYLSKIIQLCESKGIKLSILSPPINEEFKNEISHIQQEIILANPTYLKPYIASINYYSKKYYLPDNIHLQNFHFYKKLII
jgi:hypothetical protein